MACYKGIYYTALAMGMLSVFVNSAQSYSHAKIVMPKQSRAKAAPALRGARLVATGDYISTTELLKVITEDNHFAWIKVAISTTLVRAGKRVNADAIQEGDNLLCLGTWARGGDDRILQATQVRVIGQVSYMRLHDKIAAACQSVTMGNSDKIAMSEDTNVPLSRAPEVSGEASGSETILRRRAIKSYIATVSSRLKAAGEAQGRLMNLITDVETNRADYYLYQDRYFRAIYEYEDATEKLRGISPVPIEMSHSNDLLQQSCAKDRQLAVYARDNFPLLLSDIPSERFDETMKQYIAEDSELFDESTEEAQKAVDKLAQ